MYFVYIKYVFINRDGFSLLSMFLFSRFKKAYHYNVCPNLAVLLVCTYNVVAKVMRLSQLVKPEKQE